MAIGAPFSGAGEAAIWAVPAVILVLFAVWMVLLKRYRREPTAEVRGEAPFDRPDAELTRQGGTAASPAPDHRPDEERA